MPERLTISEDDEHYYYGGDCMTAQEAIVELEIMWKCGVEQHSPYWRDALDMATNALRRQIESEKYRFHDLRKDPDDLPDHEVMAYDAHGEHLAGYVSRGEYGNLLCETDGCLMYECIGWREIPKAGDI